MSEFEVGSHVLLNLQSDEFCKGMSKHTWQIVGISRSGFHVKSINNPDFNGLIVDKSALVPLTEINQQSEIDQLKVQLSLQRDRNKALEAELTSSRNYGDQLKAEKADIESRFDKAFHAVHVAKYNRDVHLIDVSIDSVFNSIKALRGGDQKERGGHE